MSSTETTRAGNALYITYDGLLEPLGRSQILPYLFELAGHGWTFHVLSFEKRADLRDAQRVSELEEDLRGRGIRWTRLRYHKWPPVLSTLWDIVKGILTAIRSALSTEFQLVHARSYVASLMALPVKSLGRTRLIFDMRGFWPEERVELGLFRSGGFLYRSAKLVERVLCRKADSLIVLTESAKLTIASTEPESPPIHVIPCCVDTRRFSPRPANRCLADRFGLRDATVVGNLGSVNRRYLLPEMFSFFTHLRRLVPNARFVYLTRQDPDLIRGPARTRGLSDDDLIVIGASPEEVPEWLSLFQLALFFLRPSHAARGSSFTKLGEFLASGVPIVTNAGVGDVDRLFDTRNVGVLVPDFREETLSKAAKTAADLLPDSRLRDRCRRAAIEEFDLELGARRYLSVYQTNLAIPAPERLRQCAESLER